MFFHERWHGGENECQAQAQLSSQTNERHSYYPGFMQPYHHKIQTIQLANAYSSRLPLLICMKEIILQPSLNALGNVTIVNAVLFLPKELGSTILIPQSSPKLSISHSSCMTFIQALPFHHWWYHSDALYDILRHCAHSSKQFKHM